MKILGKIVLAGLLSTALLNAEIAFDLQAQHFSKAIDGKYEGARYELPKTFISTNLRYQDGYYITKNSSGYLNVEIKEPRLNWSISCDTFYRFNINHKRTRTIKLISENGESIMVSFKYNDTRFNSKKVYGETTATRVTTAFKQDGDKIELVINGVSVETVSKANFKKLKYVEIQVIQEGDYFDRLNNLTIGSK